MLFSCGKGNDPQKQNDPENNKENGGTDSAVFPSVIVLDADNVASCVGDDENGKYTITFIGDVPELGGGSVLCFNPEIGGKGVFLVTKAVLNGKTLEIYGQQGDLQYVFRDTTFSLSTAVEEVKNSLPEKKGISLWGVKYSKSFNLYKNDNVSLTAGVAMSSGLDAEFSFDFNGMAETIIDGVKFLKSKQFTTTFKLIGSLDWQTDFDLKAQTEVDIDLAPGEKDKEELLKHNFLPAVDLCFWVNGIPVPIHFGCDLFHEVRAKIKGNMELNAGFGTSFRGESGFSYDWSGDEQAFKPINNRQFEIIKQHPTFSGYGEISGTYYVFPRFYAWIDFAAGPALEIRPYAKTVLSGAIRKDLIETSQSDYLTALFNASVGAEWAIGLSTPLENYFYEASRLMKNMGVIKEKDVIKSPVALKLASANTDRVRKGVSTSVSLSVLADYYGEQELSYFPAIVKIEIPRAGITTYRYTGIGQVDYSWTPQSDEEILYASIFAKDGQVISKVQFGDGTSTEDPEDSPGGEDDTEEELPAGAVDLGLSVKWAASNLCESGLCANPWDYGDYYAWGETSPKSEYSWSTYKWCKGSEKTFTKYCSISSYGYNGFTDTKTTLELEDDAARVKLGGKWRMPTNEEWIELRTKCNWVKASYYGRNGMLVCGNGYFIFIPAAGCWADASLNDAGSVGRYWSSSLCTDLPYDAWAEFFKLGTVSEYGDCRCGGFSIRPVTE